MGVERALRVGLAALALAAFGASESRADDKIWKDNPFMAERREPETLNPSREELSLQGIVWDAASPTAIINNRVVGAGDTIGAWEVKEIRRDKVVLSDGQTLKELSAL